MRTNLRLISAGDCSVCLDAGDVVFVRKRGVVDSIEPPEALAPERLGLLDEPRTSSQD